MGDVISGAGIALAVAVATVMTSRRTCWLTVGLLAAFTAWVLHDVFAAGRCY